MSCQDQLFKALRQQGMRVTPQREIILTVLHDFADHATADEIFRRVQAQSGAIDISTVYRTLELLGDMKMLAVVDAPDGQRRYALKHTHDEHAHLVCSECGGVMEVDPQPLRELARALRQQHGFALAIDHVTLTGHCPACCP
ncbi:MAG: transcriptional repressor [Anaerolineae bacterium]|jgi:Fur family ferric uptake transcriptional regulator|nr:transcriptional repressor [Anaerolineae bacterium]